MNAAMATGELRTTNWGGGKKDCEQSDFSILGKQIVWVFGTVGNLP